MNVPPNTTPGVYNVQYQICLTADNTVCDVAIATILINNDSCTTEKGMLSVIKN